MSHVSHKTTKKILRSIKIKRIEEMNRNDSYRGFNKAVWQVICG
jgi:hypothetical protein